MARPKKSAPAKAPVSAAAEVVEAVKETVAAKKAAVQKVEEVYLQAGGCEWNVSDCKERAVAYGTFMLFPRLGPAHSRPAGAAHRRSRLPESKKEYSASQRLVPI